MIVKTFNIPPIENNNYVLIDEETKEAALIDCSSPSIWKSVPKGSGNVATSFLGENREGVNGVNLKYILLTHGHFDHIGGIGPDNNIPVLIGNNL